MIGETREAIEAYCVAVGLVVYEWNDLHEKLARLFALVREGDRQETLTQWYAIRTDTRQREKLRCAITGTTSGRWKKSPRAPDDLEWLLDRADKLASDRNNAIHAPCSLYLRGDGSSEVMAAVRSANAGNRRARNEIKAASGSLTTVILSLSVVTLRINRATARYSECVGSVDRAKSPE